MMKNHEKKKVLLGNNGKDWYELIYSYDIDKEEVNF